LNGGEGDGGETIDHILTKTSASPIMTGRILEGTTSLDTTDGPVDHNLSDHYGVQLTLEP